MSSKEPTLGGGDFRALFAVLPESYVLIGAQSPDFPILEVSQGYLHAMVFTRDEVIGRRLFDVFPEQLFATMTIDHEQMRQTFEEAVAERKPRSMGTMRYDRVLPEAGELVLERYWRPFLIPIVDADGEVRTILMRVDDVTDTVIAARDEAMARQDEKADEVVIDRVHRQYLQLLMQAPVAIGLLEGKEQTITLSNPANDRISPRPLPIGRTIREVYPEPELDRFFSILDRVRETGIPYFGKEVCLPIPGRSGPVYVTVALLPMRDHHGKIHGVASFGYDVTEHIEMRQAFQRESERKDELLAMLGHELRSPLTPIAHANDLLRLQTDVPDPEDLLAATTTIDRQLRQLRRHVDDLLDIALITRGQMVMARQDVSLEELLSSAVETCRHTLSAKEQDLEMVISDPSLWVRVDRERLVQVVTNLLDNASKYSGAGGPIRLEARHEGQGDQQRLTIVLSDEGEGIEKERLEEIFDVFAQGKATIDRSRGGLGLGLTLVRRIVEGHGGSVHAESAGPGKGSSFTVSLPAPRRPPVPKAPLRALPTLDEICVLIVDDLPKLAEALARLLRKQGARAHVATSGAEAIALAQELDVTHIMIDIGLPDINGYEVARRLRRKLKITSPRLVAFTGYGQPEDVARALDAGFDRHLVKPAGIEELIAALLD